ncbi:hypothetical protein ACOI1C_06395 [Bacillus sp. DJP31]|uniref:hypothetical protein n=1 Tax=Bacillus sp. DJP31 TaxID=3409789 RepID=UPI003BB80A29
MLHHASFGIVIFGKILLSIIAYFIVTLPFRKLESIEFGGLKYKEQAKRQEEIADRAIETIQADELKRLSFIHTVATNEDIYQGISNCVNSYNSFNQFLASEYLASLLHATFPDFTEIGVVSIDNNQLNTNQMTTLHKKKSEVIRQSFNHKQKYLDEAEDKYFAVPLLYQENEQDFTILYGVSSKSLTESDLLMILSAWGIITYQIDLAMSQFSMEASTGS